MSQRTHECNAHEQSHTHGPGCGHRRVAHGDHFDYEVDGHLHHPTDDGCESHGPADR